MWTPRLKFNMLGRFVGSPGAGFVLELGPEVARTGLAAEQWWRRRPCFFSGGLGGGGWRLSCWGGAMVVGEDVEGLERRWGWADVGARRQPGGGAVMAGRARAQGGWWPFIGG